MTDRRIRICKWEKFQQYKDREPKWIKLYRALNRKYEWCQLSESARAQLVGLWLLAAEIGNEIPFDEDWIKAQISTKSKLKIDELCTAGFVAVYDAVQNRTEDQAGLYTETETERETETETEREMSILTDASEDLARSPAEDSRRKTDKQRIEAVVEFWNEKENLTPRISAMPGHRRAAILKRFEQHGWDAVKVVLANRATSNFLRFEIHNNKGADVDWCFGPKNFVKILEGKYND